MHGHIAASYIKRYHFSTKRVRRTCELFGSGHIIKRVPNWQLRHTIHPHLHQQWLGTDALRSIEYVFIPSGRDRNNEYACSYLPLRQELSEYQESYKALILQFSKSNASSNALKYQHSRWPVENPVLLVGQNIVSNSSTKIICIAMRHTL